MHIPRARFCDVAGPPSGQGKYSFGIPKPYSEVPHKCTSHLGLGLVQIFQATDPTGIYAYRVQSNFEWRLHSAATRRLVAGIGIIYRCDGTLT